MMGYLEEKPLRRVEEGYSLGGTQIEAVLRESMLQSTSIFSAMTFA
jgi:hypothetical protein